VTVSWRRRPQHSTGHAQVCTAQRHPAHMNEERHTCWHLLLLQANSLTLKSQPHPACRLGTYMRTHQLLYDVGIHKDCPSVQGKKAGCGHPDKRGGALPCQWHPQQPLPPAAASPPPACQAYMHSAGNCCLPAAAAAPAAEGGWSAAQCKLPRGQRQQQ
jgi:hypothetical protein